jgi:hypothetical protein
MARLFAVCQLSSKAFVKRRGGGLTGRGTGSRAVVETGKSGICASRRAGCSTAPTPNTHTAFLQFIYGANRYLDGPLPAGVVKGSKEVSPDWAVTFNAKHSNALTIEACGDVVLNIRFASQEVLRRALPASHSVLLAAAHSCVASGRSRSRRRLRARPVCSAALQRAQFFKTFWVWINLVAPIGTLRYQHRASDEDRSDSLRDSQFGQ